MLKPNVNFSEKRKFTLRKCDKHIIENIIMNRGELYFFITVVGAYTDQTKKYKSNEFRCRCMRVANNPWMPIVLKRMQKCFEECSCTLYTNWN